METGTVIVAPEALVKLMEALQSFRAGSNALVQDVQGELTRRLGRLEACREEAQQVVRHQCRRVSECGEDDRDVAQSDLEEAERRLAMIDHWLSQVETSFSNFKRANLIARELVGSRLPGAAAFLEKKVRILVDLESLPIPAEGAEIGRSGLSSTAIPPGVSVGSFLGGNNGIDRGIVGAQLPSGFTWVSLDSISRADDLRPEETFHKVSEKEVVHGFAVLRDEVLPALVSDTAASRDIFYDIDRNKGRAYADGAQRIFEAFFGDDAIVLGKGIGDSLYGVTNGRHRIHVARSLGWPAIPARII